jgi:endonuclease/exonuclease/phosphatase (EEP) superfamily protein YafD
LFTRLKRSLRVAVISSACFALVLAGASELRQIGGPPELAVLEFTPSWLLWLGALPLALLPMPRLLRPVLVVGPLVMAWIALDYRLGGCDKPMDTAPSVHLATYNVGGGVIVPAEVLLWYSQLGLDALVLQEVNQPRYWRRAAKEARLRFACQGKLCVVSHHRIAQTDAIDRRPSGGWGTLAANFDLCFDEHCIPLTAIHLATPRHAIEALLDGWARGRASAYLADRVSESARASALLVTADAVVAGDFNMTQRSPLYRRYWGEWMNAFGTAGCGLGHTKFTRRVSARIDHILAGPAYRLGRVEVHGGFGGDHRPLSARLLLPTATGD